MDFETKLNYQTKVHQTSKVADQSRKSELPSDANSGSVSDEGLVWLLPEIIGDITVAGGSGVVEFQVGVPVECFFDEVEARVAGVLVEPMQLKPGLHSVYLHFFDLFRNSIVLGELRLTGANCTHVLPFHLTVTDTEQADFVHAQVFSEDQKQAWGVETDNAGESVWKHISQSFLTRLAEFEQQTHQRPCKRSDLERMEKEFERGVALLRSRREELRIRNAFLPDPPNLVSGIHRVRAGLRQTYAEHKMASSAVRRLHELVETGHIERAETEAAEVRPKVSAFTDLDLGFVAESRRQFDRARRRLIIVGAVLAATIFLAALIIKLFARPTSTMP